MVSLEKAIGDVTAKFCNEIIFFFYLVVGLKIFNFYGKFSVFLNAKVSS
jgi:hypothetical protein